MIKINIKPLSVNKAWQGKRFKTPQYKEYEKNVLLMLPKVKPPPPPFKIVLEFGFSSSASDIDNPLKPFIDILQKKYGINDKDIFELNVKKINVKKGFEYVSFEITTHPNY
jgi:Holliday junction resolvase RusA-like endonuclease